MPNSNISTDVAADDPVNRSEEEDPNPEYFIELQVSKSQEEITKLFQDSRKITSLMNGYKY